MIRSAYSFGSAVAERTLNQTGNTLAQSTPTCQEPPSSARDLVELGRGQELEGVVQHGENALVSELANRRAELVAVNLLAFRRHWLFVAATMPDLALKSNVGRDAQQPC